MKNLVFLVALTFSTSLFVSPSAQAEMDTFAQTTANKLNVRSLPNGKTVVEQLPYGSVVAILQTKDVWTNILYLEDNDPANPKQGWVSSLYLQILYSKDMRDYDNRKIAGI